jgi:hypothetical protein
MSIMMNIATPNSQTATSGNGIIASSNSSSSAKIGSSEFGSLIATLLGLSAPKQNTQAPNSADVKQGNANQAIKPALAALNLATGLAGEAGQAPKEQTAISAIADLLKAVEAFETSLNSGEPIKQEVVDSAIGAINALIAKLEAIAPSPVMAVVSGIGSQLQNSAGAKNAILEITNNTLANNTFANTQPIKEALGALSSKETIANLSQLAQKLGDVAQNTISQNSTLSELSQKISQLGQKLEQIAPLNLARQSANNAAISMNVDRSNNEAAKSIAALMGTKAGVSQNNVELGGAKLEMAEIAIAKAQKIAQSSSTNIYSSNEAGTKGSNIISNAIIAPNMNASATMANAAPNAIKIDIAGSSNILSADPLVATQGLSQANVNTSFAPNINPATALYQGAAQNLNLPHIAYEFARNVQNGATRFQIRLDPPEMGRIDVKMEIDKSGALSARLTVERPDTLDLLQRDVRALERALAQAGLDSNKTNLEFALKENPFERNNDGFASGSENLSENLSEQNDENDSDILSQMPSAIIYRGTASPNGLNITA